MPYRTILDPSRSLQQEMMVYEMLRKQALGPSATDAFLEDLQKQRNVEKEQARRERATQADIEEGLARTQQGQGRLDLETWKYGREDVRAEAKSAADIEEAKAHTGLYKQQTQGEIEDNARKQNVSLIDFARRRQNAAIAQVIGGTPLDSDATDLYEKDQRLLTGNQNLTLPRNPDGSWQVDQKKLAATVLDKDGLPNPDFAKGLREIAKPYEPFGQLIADANEARAGGATPEEMRPYTDKIRKEIAPTSAGQVEGEIAQTLLDDGNVEGAMDALKQLRGASKTVIKIPDPKERQERQQQLIMVSDLNDIQKQFETLKASGRIPVTAFRQPMFDVLAYLGKDDPYITTFRKKLDSFKARYLLYLSGRAATDSERNDIKRQVPSRFDSIQTFEMAIPDFRDKVMKDIAIDNGVAESYGLAVDPSLPKINPGDLLRQGKNLPNFVTSTGTIPGAEVERHVSGVSSLAEQYRRAKSRVGGVEEFRQSAPVQGMSTDTSEEPDLSEFTDPARAAQLMQRMQEIQDLQRKEAEGQ